ncbi:hypothetical protein EVAR_85971_1 [Eumeta japonica]|uniref:Uncharacterized protein n=1 Tax=Eumeta variegata TaxID=151549 RepID=A0A4C1UJG9_EUMVA|nr:hypothetical protein EVAR_85971_1 [Eumeta japonica]
MKVEEDRQFLLAQHTSISSEIVTAVPSTVKPPARKQDRVELVDSHLASSLDAAKLSRPLAVSVKSIVKKIVESLKREFKINLPLTVHWDGKLLEDITGHETVDRLPILVSGQGIDQLLLVPKLDRGTGEACASAVHGTILEWGLSDKYQPRNDYKELVSLTIIYLGGVPEKRTLFRMPAGLHRVRWMAKAMYCLKIFLFGHQFKMTKEEEKGLVERATRSRIETQDLGKELASMAGLKSRTVPEAELKAGTRLGRQQDLSLYKMREHILCLRERRLGGKLVLICS